MTKRAALIQQAVLRAINPSADWSNIALVVEQSVKIPRNGWTEVRHVLQELLDEGVIRRDPAICWEVYHRLD